MSQKAKLEFVVEASKSLAASFTTTPTLIPNIDNISYQIIITTTNSVGTFAVQGSNDYAATPDAVTNAGNWADLTLGGGTPYANAANDDILISMNQVPFKALRIAYTSSVAGTGTCAIKLFAKRLGG